MKTVVREPTMTELAKIERFECWLEYLEEIRGAGQARYDEVEPWAWARLLAKLERLREKREAA